MIVAARRREFHIAISRTGDNLGARSLLSEPKRLVFEQDVSVELLFARILDGICLCPSAVLAPYTIIGGGGVR
jgi:hypothetical protein